MKLFCYDIRTLYWEYNTGIITRQVKFVMISEFKGEAIMTIYERYCEIRDRKGLKDAHVAEQSGIGRSTFSDWKSGRSEPKREKLEKIADVLGVSVEYLMTGETADGYYYDPETAALAQEIYQNPELHMLFDATRDASASDLKAFYDMVLLMKRRERHED